MWGSWYIVAQHPCEECDGRELLLIIINVTHLIHDCNCPSLVTLLDYDAIVIFLRPLDGI